MMTDYDFYRDGKGYTYDEVADEYEELLDEVYPDVQIGDLTFTAGRIVRELDPIAFRVGVSDYSSEYFTEYPDDDEEREDD